MLKQMISLKSQWVGYNEAALMNWAARSCRVASWGDLALAVQYNAAAVYAQISETVGGWGA